VGYDEYIQVRAKAMEKDPVGVDLIVVWVEMKDQTEHTTRSPQIFTQKGESPNVVDFILFLIPRKTYLKALVLRAELMYIYYSWTREKSLKRTKET
jgi:hypothetical protein